MAIPETGKDSETLSIAEAGRCLRVAPATLLDRLIRDGLLYRYTGVGRPLAYVRWVRAGLFVNTRTEVRITRKGLAHIARTLKLP